MDDTDDQKSLRSQGYEQKSFVTSRIAFSYNAPIQKNSCTHSRRVRDGLQKQLAAISVIYKRP